MIWRAIRPAVGFGVALSQISFLPSSPTNEGTE